MNIYDTEEWKALEAKEDKARTKYFEARDAKADVYKEYRDLLDKHNK